MDPTISAENNPLFKKIWQWTGPNRIKAFLWKVVHGKLLTNEERKRRGMTACDSCPRCLDSCESIMHVIQDCEDVRDWWTNLIDPKCWSKFFSLGFHSWLDWNLSSNDIGGSQIQWPTFFGIAINDLWKDRNALVFSQNTSLGRGLFFQVLNQQDFIVHQHKSGQGSSNTPSKTVEIAWQAPPDGCIKVNVDGSYYANSVSTACGGLARDSLGRFLKGFYNKLAPCNATWAELWALRSGIQLAKDMCFHWVIFELDSKVVVDMVNKGSTHIPFLQPLLQEVISILRHPDWRTTVVHIYHEANQCADLLANKGRSSTLEGVILDHSFPMLSLMLSNDYRGVSLPRVIR